MFIVNISIQTKDTILLYSLTPPPQIKKEYKNSVDPYFLDKCVEKLWREWKKERGAARDLDFSFIWLFWLRDKYGWKLHKTYDTIILEE